MKSQKLLLLALFLSLLSQSSFAYIDPGSGMAFVSGIGAFIMGFIAIAFGSLVLTFKKWIGFVKKSFNDLKQKFSHQ